jgi:tetratricopeptide (TPR) repeat protein
MDTLAMLYRDEKRFEEAESLMKKVSAIEANRKGKRGYLTSTINLCIVLRDEGKFSDADSIYQNSLPVVAIAYGKNSFEYVKAILNLAAVYVVQERTADALVLFQQAVDITEKLPASDGHSMELGTVLNSLQ